MFSCFSRCRKAEVENPVCEIDLGNSALKDVPTTIFLHERTLDTLILNSNRIKDLPLPLFYCQNLQFLNLSDNDIAVLPAAIGLLVNLKSLDINRNCIKDINESIKGCKRLSVLNLSMNPLRQFPEPITQLISLEELYLNDTGLDYLPANVGRLMRLRILELRDNRLSSLPKALARFSQLTRLDVGQNDFTYLPDVVGELDELRELWMDLNGMASFPQFVGNLKKLVHLDVSENYPEKVCEEIGECHLLTELTLTHSHIRALPASIGGITNLVTLNLDTNQLTELPITIGHLSNLEELYVSYNKLTAIPSSIGLLRKLICLGVDSNVLECLPPEIGSCTRLRVVTAQHNFLTSLPPEIGNLVNLAVLSLCDNQISSLPMSMLKMVNLKALWLVNNQSKPFTPLVKEYDRRSGTMVLSCYLLPQHDESQEEMYYTPSHSPKNPERPRIRFSVNPAVENGRPGQQLSRSPTPYPKKLRELAKTARAIATEPLHFTTDQNGELSVVNISGTNNMSAKQVRTAIVKKHAPAMVVPKIVISIESSAQSQSGKENEAPEQRINHPPPYHIAATYSKQAPYFQNETYVNREERRSDIDTEALSSLKVELLHNLPTNECQRAQSVQSMQSGSVEMIYPLSTHNGNVVRQYSIANSDVDSAFVDNTESNYKIVEPNNAGKKMTTASQFINDGTYSAFPGIIVTENSSTEHLSSENVDCLPYDSSSYPISKVNSWLTSRTKSPVTSENGCEFMNMYPCENREQFQRNGSMSNQGSPNSLRGKRQEEVITSSKITQPSKLPWLFGVHRNPKVLEVLVNNSGPELGFDIAVLDSGFYVKSVTESCQVLKEGDKILQIDGVDIKNYDNAAQVLALLHTFAVSFIVMISRQT